MDGVGVLMTCPMFAYLEQELAKRFKLYRLWDYPSPRRFFATHSGLIRAVVGNTKVGADAELIDVLPQLEIVATYSVGLDKIDLGKCREKGFRCSGPGTGTGTGPELPHCGSGSGSYMATN